MISIQHPLQSVTKADAFLLEDALRNYRIYIRSGHDLENLEAVEKIMEKVDTYYTAHLEPME